MSDDSGAAGDHIHIPNPRLFERQREGVITTLNVVRSFNRRFALLITRIVGTMWCAYAFAALALISLPAAIQGGTATLVAWIAQTFLQLVLLSIIMVGQSIGSETSDRQAAQTFKDAEALLQINDELHRLLKINNKLTSDIHAATTKK